MDDKFNDYSFTYSELFEDQEFTSQSDWLEYLSPSILEAYDEYITDKDDKEDY